MNAKNKRWDRGTRKTKHDKTMATRVQEDTESHEFSDEVILLTRTNEQMKNRTYRDALCLMTKCTPVVELHDDGIPHTPTRDLKAKIYPVIYEAIGTRESSAFIFVGTWNWTRQFVDNITRVQHWRSTSVEDAVSTINAERRKQPLAYGAPSDGVTIRYESDTHDDFPTETVESMHISSPSLPQPTVEAKSAATCTKEEPTNSPWDRSITPVDQSQLRVRESVYSGVNDHRYIVPVGRCLTCAVEVKKRQEIGVFVGNTLSPHAITLMSPARGSYLIDMSMDEEQNDIEILDCYEKAQGENPACKLSMANTATALYHREADISLTEQDNNAAVKEVSDDIVSPEMGSRGSPPESIAIPELVNMSSDDESDDDDVTDVTPAASIDESQLLVQQSIYRAANAYRHIVPIGRCLTCAVNIRKGQEIGTFKGETISPRDAAELSMERGSYLLDMAVDDEPSEIEIIDCYTNAQGENPGCKMSMANTAAALYHRETDTSLTEEDNNATVTTGLRDKIRTAVTYALRDIPAGEEIMWDYGIGCEPSPNPTPTKPLRTVTHVTDNEVGPQGNDMKCLAVSVKDSFDEGFAILDCASGTHICKNKEYAQNIQPCMPGSISGISGEQSPATYTSSCVFVDEEFGRIPLLQSAAANILSLASAKDSGFKADYNNNFDEFTLTSPRGGETYRFGRIGHGADATIGIPTPSKVYVMSLATNTPPSPSELTVLLSNVETGVRGTNDEVETGVRGTNDEESGVRDTNDTGIGVRGTNNTGTEESGVQDTNDTGIGMRGTNNTGTVHATADTECELSAGIDTTAINAVERVFVEAKGKGYNTQVVKSDNEKSLSTNEIASQLAQSRTSQDHTAPGQHASRAERRIQFIKQKTRTICQLPYKQSKELMKHAVIAANRYTNMQKAASSVSPLTPREKFLGRSSDFKRDIRMPFGSYCQCTTPNTSSNDDPRTEACVFLYPKEVTVPSFRVMRVSNGAVIARTQLIQLPMPDAIAASLDKHAEHDILDWDEAIHTGASTDNTHDNLLEDTGLGEVTRTATFLPSSESARRLMEGGDTAPTRQHAEPVEQETVGEVTHSHEQSEDHPDEVNEREAVVQVGGTPAKSQPRRSQRVQDQESTKEALESLNYWTEDMQVYALVTSFNMTCRQAESEHGSIATDSIEGELQQLVNKEFATPIPPGELTPEIIKGAIRSKMFVKQKMKPDGTIDKIKSRLVARGDQQDRTLYEGADLSATTVTCMSVFSLLAIAAKEQRKVCTADVGGAYLNASIGTDGPPVYMSIEPSLAAILSGMDNRYREATRDNGAVIVRLDKCLYGCIESARKWRLNVMQTMSDNGVKPNVYDPCRLNKTCRDGAQLTIAIYVDDILMTSTNVEEMQEIITAITERYGDVKSHREKIVEFLGMLIDMSTPGSASITMNGMEKSIGKESGVEVNSRKTSSPAADNIFDIDGDSPILPEQERKKFHCMVARLLYIAKRVRPECLMAVAFPTTRVTKATREDEAKLERIINYLRNNNNEGIVTSGYFDAAYGIHEDGKSHAGACLTVGDRGPVSVESTKQSIFTKSSTEAELVATSDPTNMLLHLGNFLTAQGYAQGPSTVYQDNMSCMSLIEKGRSTKREWIRMRSSWYTEPPRSWGRRT